MKFARSKPNFLLEIWSPELYIEARRIVIDGQRFDVSQPQEQAVANSPERVLAEKSEQPYRAGQIADCAAQRAQPAPVA